MSRAQVIVVDYHKGNLKSVERSLVEAGAQARISDSAADIAQARALVLPGVGSFADAMNYLRGSGQADQLVSALKRGVPFLGICLGLQLILERGAEGLGLFGAKDASAPQYMPGLGLIAGSVERLDSRRLKVPHVGWDNVEISDKGRQCPLLAGVDDGCTMYFTHSYVAGADVPDASVCAHTHYGTSFASVLWHDNIYACQFHPEKSSRNGMRIMHNFVRIAEKG